MWYDYQLHHCTHHRVLGWNADTVFHTVKSQRRILHFRWCDLVSTHIDGVIAPTLQAQTPFIINETQVGCRHNTVFQHTLRSLFVLPIARHQRQSLAGNVPIGRNEELSMAHSPSHTTSKTLAIVEVICRDNTRFRRRIGVEQSTHR